MAMIAPFRLFLRGGREGEATLDQPINNFDTIGIPQGAWSSGFCACYENIIPSCLLSFCCPCFQWAQVTVRSQIPLLISIKNSLPWIKRSSGYGFFVEYFFWSFVLCLALILILALVDIRPRIVWALVMIVLLVISIPLLYLVGHTRTAFKEKYSIPPVLPVGCGFWETILDMVISLFCLPCSLAQMSRHVFQYDHMEGKLGMFITDPSTLPPLPLLPSDMPAGSSQYVRPAIADTAGLYWSTDAPSPHVRDNRGAAHRREELERQQQGGLPTAPASVSAPPLAYRPDGSIV